MGVLSREEQWQQGAVLHRQAAGGCSTQGRAQQAQTSTEHPNKPELKKLYLCHHLRKSHSCLRQVFLLLVLLEGSGMGDTRGRGCRFPSAVGSGPGGLLPS